MNDKDSILADTKNLLYILYPAIQRMPKIERIEGAPVMMKSACYGIIGHFSIAKECPEVRLDHIRAMFGEYGKLLAAFDLCIQFGLLKNRTDFKRMMWLRDSVCPYWWTMCGWDGRRQCVTCLPGYTLRDRLNRQYNLHIKRHGKSRDSGTAQRPGVKAA